MAVTFTIAATPFFVCWKQEPVGGDAGKREREINPSVSMVLADEDMRSGTLVSYTERQTEDVR